MYVCIYAKGQAMNLGLLQKAKSVIIIKKTAML